MLLLAVHLRRRVLLRLPLRDPAAWLRSLFDFGASWTYFHALRHLPLAEATAVLFSFPLILTLLAALVLKERVDWTRWLAVAGPCWRLVILAPAVQGLGRGGGLGASDGLIRSLRDLTTRFVRPAVSTESVALATTGFTDLAALTTAPFGWAVPDLLGVAASRPPPRWSSWPSSGSGRHQDRSPLLHRPVPLRERAAFVFPGLPDLGPTAGRARADRHRSGGGRRATGPAPAPKQSTARSRILAFSDDCC